MIGVQSLYEDVSGVIKKNFAGFLSGPDFSDKIRTAEIKAFEHFVSYFERTSRIADALFFFIKAVKITSDATGIVNTPEDYRHHIRLSRYFMKNNPVVGGAPIVKYKKIKYAQSNAIEDIMSDFINKPCLEKGRFIYTFENGAIQLYEPAIIDTWLRYIRIPNYGKISFIANSTEDGDEYIYDPDNSQDLEWPDHVYPLIKYLILEEYGQEVRDQLIYQYGLLEGKTYKDLANA